MALEYTNTRAKIFFELNWVVRCREHFGHVWEDAVIFHIDAMVIVKEMLYTYFIYA